MNEISSNHPSSQAWTFKRNCSITPKQLAGFYGSLACVSLAIGTGFWLQGYSFVMAFTGLELVALGAALVVFARHATDKEELLLSPTQLQVRWQDGQRLHTESFNPQWVQVAQNGTDGRGLVSLHYKGQCMQVGRYLRPECRANLARELYAAIRQMNR